MDQRYGTPAGGRSTPFQSTTKMSSRPRIPSNPRATPSLTRSPPLTTSLNDNQPPPKPKSLETGHVLLKQSVMSPGLQKDSTTRLKIRPSAITPEPRSRTAVRPSTIIRTPGMLGGVVSAAKRMHRAITPSDSDGSLVDMYGALPSSNSELEEPIQELGSSETVLVTVRVRPPNQSEMQRDGASVWETPYYDHHLLKVAKGGDGAKDDREWLFDRILGAESDNARAYATSARAHVQSAMEGYNAVIFAYGQTASGKTFTLSGSPSNPGIIPLSIADLFAGIRNTPDREFLLRASYLELYNETILDLLSPGSGKELSLSEGKKKGDIIINGLTECAVRTEEEVRKLLRTGEDRRKVGGTDWNTRSSRSHCVFRIVIESRAANGSAADDMTKTPSGRVKASGDTMTRISTLSIIDLAGSEKHTSSKERNAEGKHINQSLLTLKLVISKLADMASGRNVPHIPYRDSKLTRMLQPSLSGDALISVICTVSPSALNLAESLSTLAFAQGLKRVLLKAQKKEVVDPQALIQQYQGEIAELKALLREKQGYSGSGETPGRSGERQKNEAMEKRLNELKSLILTSVNVSSHADTHDGMARPLSPTKLKYRKLDFDKTTTELQEQLHDAQARLQDQEDEIKRLGWELELRPRNTDARIVELQDKIKGLELIEADYERHLREPTRKVREDVEKEWSVKVSKLENQLESKRIWANRLDENFRAVAAENKELTERCKEAENKVFQIIEWINAAISDVPSDISPSDSEMDFGGKLPTLIVSQDLPSDDDFGLGLEDRGDDFGPPLPAKRQSTITLTNSKMTRAQLSTIDLASFNEQFGSLGVGR